MFSQFNSNCTLPPTITNWVSQPNSRGTFDILWTSLTTLFLCTWSVQHPNVPSIEHKGIKLKLKWIGKKLLLMTTTLLVPEFLLLKSVSDNAAASILTKEIGQRVKEDRVTWSKVHSYFANMGGFVIDFSTLKEEDVPDPIMENKVRVRATESSGTPTLSSIETASISAWQEHDIEKAVQKLSSHQSWLMRIITMPEEKLPELPHRHTMLVRSALGDLKEMVMTEESTRKTKDDINKKVTNLIRLRSRYWALDGIQLTVARDLGIIDKLPDVEEVDIEGKSNSDSLAKFLAVLQTLWQTVELLQRWAQGESSSQIEVVTVAYCACTFIMYLMIWSKPQEVDRPILMSPVRWPTKEEMVQISDIGPENELGMFTGFHYNIPENAVHGTLDVKHAGGFSSLFAAIFGGVLFGLLHCVAWNFLFPTMVEQKLWRISSIMTTAVPIFYAVRHLPVITRLERRVPFVLDFVSPAFAMILGILYMFCRMFLLVETFRSLAFLPPGTYRK